MSARRPNRKEPRPAQHAQHDAGERTGSSYLLRIKGPVDSLLFDKASSSYLSHLAQRDIVYGRLAFTGGSPAETTTPQALRNMEVWICLVCTKNDPRRWIKGLFLNCGHKGTGRSLEGPDPALEVSAEQRLLFLFRRQAVVLPPAAGSFSPPNMHVTCFLFECFSKRPMRHSKLPLRKRNMAFTERFRAQRQHCSVRLPWRPRCPRCGSTRWRHTSVSVCCISGSTFL